MHVNNTNLRALYVAFHAAFAAGLGMAQSSWRDIATVVPSSTGENEYGWLGQLPNMREWIGDREVHALALHGYSVKNKSFELTIGVDRDKIEDDNIGIYTPMFQEMGRATEAHPDQLVFGLLKTAHETLCYDGQNFFDTDHPVIGADGAVASQSNVDENSGSGTPWYLLDTSRALKPIIFQDRKKPEFVAKDRVEDDNVFDRKEFRYGVDSRCNVGLGFWQMAYRSRKTLDETNLVAAFTAMTERTGDHGRPLGIRPTLLVVPPSLEFAAAKLVNATTLANGADNVLKGLVQVRAPAWLAG